LTALDQAVTHHQPTQAKILPGLYKIGLHWGSGGTAMERPQGIGGSMLTERKSERLAHMWPIKYQLPAGKMKDTRERLGLCLNVGSGGMLLLLDQAPPKGQILELHITDLNTASRTRGEVRWRRQGSSWFKRMSLVGVKYINEPQRNKDRERG
jgi:hypothetical protein